MAEHTLAECAKAIAEALEPNSVVVILTGAGVSSESGVPTYRGRVGLWSRSELQFLADAEALRRMPRLAWEFFQQIRETLAAARPNPAHYALAEIDEMLRPTMRASIITQNIDGLHQAAGSRHVVELHGNAARFHCMVCGCNHSFMPMRLAELPPRCACGGVIRPDIVLFGEPLPTAAWQEAQALVEQAKVMIIVGTSLQVEPAASLPLEGLRHGALLIEINLDATFVSHKAHFRIHGFASQVLPLLAQHLARALGRSPRRAPVPKA
jgi:NAD-dependent deacetylase